MRVLTNHAGTLHAAFSARFSGYMVAIRDGSYFLKVILIKGNILAYVSLFDKNETYEEIMHLLVYCSIQSL